MKYFIYIISCVILHSYAVAQQFYIKGEVRDEAGNSLQNVTILQHSTGYLFYSGSLGSFGIVSTRSTDSLSFSLSGYQPQHIAIKATEYIRVKLKKSDLGLRGPKLSSFTKNLQREIQQQWFIGDETYASIIENHFINTTAYPATDLKLNVDRASYSNIRRFLNMNSPVPPDAVRLEEMLNYFNFNYTEPPDNKTFTIVTTLTGCPWNEDHQLLFAKITSRKINTDTLPPTHLVFLIDVSGSMDMPNRLPILKAGFQALINNLRAKDSVSVVIYGGIVGPLCTAVSGANKDSIFKVIDNLEASGATPGESGIKIAYNVARSHFIKGGNNRIILATDGDFNVGARSDKDLEEMIIKQKESGIYLTCLGVGMGNYKDSKIQTLAQKGNGNFAYLDSYAEAEKVLLKEFAQTLYTVADEAYLHVKFNPDLVKEYRVIGFDNKVGAIKDSLATMDGGEIGSAYSLLIAFEIKPTDNNLAAIAQKKEITPCLLSLQYKEAGTKTLQAVSYESRTSYMPFNQLNKMYRFASAVVMFGSVLRNSAFVKEPGWNTILEIAAESADMDNHSQKEFLTLVQQAKKVYRKKR